MAGPRPGPVRKLVPLALPRALPPKSPAPPRNELRLLGGAFLRTSFGAEFLHKVDEYAFRAIVQSVSDDAGGGITQQGLGYALSVRRYLIAQDALSVVLLAEAGALLLELVGGDETMSLGATYVAAGPELQYRLENWVAFFAAGPGQNFLPDTYSSTDGEYELPSAGGMLFGRGGASFSF
jgi:hypothetical protein